MVVREVSERRHRVGGGHLLVGVELAHSEQEEDGHHTSDDEHQEEHGEPTDETGYRQADVVGVEVTEVLHDHRFVLVGVEREGYVTGRNNLDQTSGGDVRHFEHVTFGASGCRRRCGVGVEVHHAGTSQVQTLFFLVFRFGSDALAFDAGVALLGSAGSAVDGYGHPRVDAGIGHCLTVRRGCVAEVTGSRAALGAIARRFRAAVAAHLDHALEVDVHRIREFEGL